MIELLALVLFVWACHWVGDIFDGLSASHRQQSRRTRYGGINEEFWPSVHRTEEKPLPRLRG